MNSSKRLAAGLLFAVAASASIAGCNLLKKATPDAGTVAVEAAAASAPVPSATVAEQAPLPAECEIYLAQFDCYLAKTKKDPKAADDMRASLNEAAKASVQSATDMCNGQLAAKMADFKAQGCTSATAPPPVVTAKVDAGVKDASTDAKVVDAATAVTADASATATASADGGKKCTRAQECPETDACESGACVTKCKGQVWVDTAKACGDVCSNSALLGKKCADGFVCTPHGRGVGGCIKK